MKKKRKGSEERKPWPFATFLPFPTKRRSSLTPKPSSRLRLGKYLAQPLCWGAITEPGYAPTAEPLTVCRECLIQARTHLMPSCWPRYCPTPPSARWPCGRRCHMPLAAGGIWEVNGTRGTCCHQLSSSERSAYTLYAVTQSLTASKTGLAWHTQMPYL